MNEKIVNKNISIQISLCKKKTTNQYRQLNSINQLKKNKLLKTNSNSFSFKKNNNNVEEK
jgi:hypothetical protein